MVRLSGGLQPFAVATLAQFISARFDNQIEIESTGKGPFSLGGDSGSLIFDGDRLGVALLFAGSDVGGSNGQGLTYAYPLPGALAALKLELA